MLILGTLLGIGTGTLLIYDGLKSPRWTNPVSRILICTAGFLFFAMVYVLHSQ